MEIKTISEYMMILVQNAAKQGQFDMRDQILLKQTENFEEFVITKLLALEDVEFQSYETNKALKARIKDLEVENAKLKADLQKAMNRGDTDGDRSPADTPDDDDDSDDDDWAWWDDLAWDDPEDDDHDNGDDSDVYEEYTECDACEDDPADSTPPTSTTTPAHFYRYDEAEVAALNDEDIDDLVDALSAGDPTDK